MKIEHKYRVPTKIVCNLRVTGVKTPQNSGFISDTFTAYGIST